MNIEMWPGLVVSAALVWWFVLFLLGVEKTAQPEVVPKVAAYTKYEDFRADATNPDVPIDKILERAAVAGVPKRPGVVAVGAPKKWVLAGTPSGSKWLLQNGWEVKYFDAGEPDKLRGESFTPVILDGHGNPCKCSWCRTT